MKNNKDVISLLKECDKVHRSLAMDPDTIEEELYNIKENSDRVKENMEIFNEYAENNEENVFIISFTFTF